MFFVGDFPNGNSSNARFKQFARYYKQQGFQVNLYSYLPYAFSSGKTVMEWEEMQFRYLSGDAVYHRKKLKRGLQVLRSNINALKVVAKRDHKFDVFLFFNPRRFDGLIQMACLKLLRRTIHVDQQELFSTRYSGYKWQEKSIANWADPLIVISKALHDHFSRLQGKGKLLHIPIMVDMKRFKPFRTKDQSMTIGYIGNFDKKDNVPQLIEAFSLAVKEFPSLKLKLMGYDRNLSDTLSVAEEFGVEDKVEMTGPLQYEEIGKLLCSCDTLVLNRSKEKFSAYGYPIKLAEYLATGRPVLMSRIGSYDLDFKHEHSVLKFEPDHPKHLADSIVWRYSNYQRSDAIGQEGLLLSEELFSTENLNSLL